MFKTSSYKEIFKPLKRLEICESTPYGVYANNSDTFSELFRTPSRGLPSSLVASSFELEAAHIRNISVKTIRGF